MKKFLFIIFFFSVCMQAQEIREVKGKTICCDADGNTLTADVIESRAHANACWVVLSSDYDNADGDCETGLEASPNNVMGFRCKIYTFMSHNLGADESHNAMTPSWKLNGAYYQWNRKNPVASAPTVDDDTPVLIGTWDTSYEPGPEWAEANDPCPEGYSIPSKAIWNEVISYNTWASVGSWSNSSSNYTSGKMVTPRGSDSPTLFLPTTGRLASTDGSLNVRGEKGFYWSSSQDDSESAFRLHFLNLNQYTQVAKSWKSYGFTIRCIAD